MVSTIQLTPAKMQMYKKPGKPSISLINIINHRDFVLILALVAGFLLGDHTRVLADMSVYTLALVMIFSTTGFTFRSWVPLNNALTPIVWSALLNYFIFGMVTIALAWFIFRESAEYAFFIGFVLLAAAPPGPSVIPFASMIKGDDHFSVTGVFGLHMLAMLLTPLILWVFLGQALIHPMDVFIIMVKLVVMPLILSRMLRHKKVLPLVEKSRETVIKWGFFLVVMPIMGMSAGVLTSQPWAVLKVSALVIISMYGLGFAYHYLMVLRGKKHAFIVSSTLMMVTKSSAFSAVAAFSFFGDEPMVALPSAVVSVFVTLFIIVYPRFIRLTDLLASRRLSR